MATCHAVIEDNLIFVAIGGNGWIMLGLRLLLAVFITALLARLWRPGVAWIYLIGSLLFDLFCRIGYIAQTLCSGLLILY